MNTPPGDKAAEVTRHQGSHMRMIQPHWHAVASDEQLMALSPAAGRATSAI